MGNVTTDRDACIHKFVCTHKQCPPYCKHFREDPAVIPPRETLHFTEGDLRQMFVDFLLKHKNIEADVDHLHVHCARCDHDVIQITTF